MSPSCSSTAIMPSPSDQPPISSTSQSNYPAKRAVLPPEADAVDLKQLYLLIDSILPFEACLYYQVLPLTIDGSRLIVGTVNPDDPGAIEYVKKQLSYINYSIGFRKISSDGHRDLLSKYLSHTAKQRQQVKNEAAAVSHSKNGSADSSRPDLQGTLVVDQPEEITEHLYRDPAIDSNIEQTFQLEGPTSTGAGSKRQVDYRNQQPHVEQPSLVKAQQLQELGRANDPLHLNLDHRYRNIENSRLLYLPPHALMQALLSKVLDEGIGRLYFERRQTTGRILWSRDGILQAVVESINAQLFQGVINELKRLTRLSLIAVKKSKQVEIERSYEGQRILMRFRVIPSAYGEEATLQVLRGTALRFYQQQQIDRLGRDALDTAQVLQNRLNEIRDRARSSLNFKPTRSETLPALVELLHQMEAQVEEILAAYELIDASEESSSEESSFEL